MKKILLFLSFLLMSIGVWGATWQLVANDFNTTSYAANNGDHTKDGITYNSNQVMKSSSTIQFQANNGTIYNKTPFSGNITKITAGGGLTIKVGTSQNPSSGTTVTSGSTISGNYTYFWIKKDSKYAANVSSIIVEYSTSPTPITKYSVTFINCDTIYEQRENIKQDSTITDFPTGIEPNDACKKNGWEFIGWTKKGTNTINSLEVTKNDTLYALYKLTNFGEGYITDTLTNEKIGVSVGGGSPRYYDFNDVRSQSNAIYCGNSAGGWATGSNNPPGATIQLRDNSGSGIISRTSGGLLYSAKVKWNSKEQTERWVKFYCSDTAFSSTEGLYKSIRTNDSIKNGNEYILLEPKPYIGIRSKTGTIYLDTIFITWKILCETPSYSTNPKCFDTNISVAEWHKDHVEFDVGNYDSIHTYRGQMNSCDSIRITLVNENDEECIRWFHVPIFAGAHTPIDNSTCNVVVLGDSTLTITSTTNSSNIYIYPGGKLVIGTLTGVVNDTLKVNSLTLRRDNDSVPQLMLYNDGFIVVKNKMFFEMRTDAEDWRWLTLPDSIKYSQLSNETTTISKYYDGATRAKNGKGGWQVLRKDTVAGFGTIFGIDFNDDKKRIYKVELDTAILRLEKSNKNIPVKKFFYSNKPKNNLGWNLVGNPYMAIYNVSTEFGAIFNQSDSLKQEIDANGNWTGRWDTVPGKKLRYIVIPSWDTPEEIAAGGYKQVCLQNGYKLKPFTSFFVQAKEGGNLVFYHGQRVANAPAKIKSSNNSESFLQLQIGSLKTGCYISNKFTDDYEIGDDMESLYQTYQLINGYKLLYSAINDSIINSGIHVYTNGGSVSLDNKTDINDFEEISIFYNGNWYDLLHGQTVNANGEFILQARRKQADDIPTDIEMIIDNNIEKFIQNNTLYIKKNNHIYNILGGVIK